VTRFSSDHHFGMNVAGPSSEWPPFSSSSLTSHYNAVSNSSSAATTQEFPFQIPPTVTRTPYNNQWGRQASSVSLYIILRLWTISDWLKTNLARSQPLASADHNTLVASGNPTYARLLQTNSDLSVRCQTLQCVLPWGFFIFQLLNSLQGSILHACDVDPTNFPIHSETTTDRNSTRFKLSPFHKASSLFSLTFSRRFSICCFLEPCRFYSIRFRPDFNL
jgi:hypothetical protein